MTITSDGRKQYVLVVDSDGFRGRRLAEALSDQGYYSAFVTSGGEAMRYVLENEPDVLVAEWDLPDLDGLELARQITLGRLETKIILERNDVDWRALRTAMECGAEEVLPHATPIDVMSRVLDRSGCRRRLAAC